MMCCSDITAGVSVAELVFYCKCIQQNVCNTGQQEHSEITHIKSSALFIRPHYASMHNIIIYNTTRWLVLVIAQRFTAQLCLKWNLTVVDTLSSV